MQKPSLMHYPENAELTAAAPKLKPARSRTWISVGIFSFICLLLLGAGAWGLSSFLPSFSKPTEPLARQQPIRWQALLSL